MAQRPVVSGRKGALRTRPRRRGRRSGARPPASPRPAVNAQSARCETRPARFGLTPGRVEGQPGPNRPRPAGLTCGGADAPVALKERVSPRWDCSLRCSAFLSCTACRQAKTHFGQAKYAGPSPATVQEGAYPATAETVARTVISTAQRTTPGPSACEKLRGLRSFFKRIRPFVAHVTLSAWREQANAVRAISFPPQEPRQ
jgi:hypothetical protein